MARVPPRESRKPSFITNLLTLTSQKMCVGEKSSERNSFAMARIRANCTSFSSSPKSLSLSGEPVE